MVKKIAIEYDTEDQASYTPQVENMVAKLGFIPETISSDQIINGGLIGFDAVIFPGGAGAFYGLRNYKDFGEAVRYFVASGGGFMGVCGGAIVAGVRLSALYHSYCPKTLNLIDVRAASPPWMKFIQEYQEAAGERVRVTCKITDAPHPVVNQHEGELVDIVYSSGPLMDELDPGVVPLFTYVNDIMPPGSVAGCCSAFGKGRVLLSGPHPETPWGEDLIDSGCQEWLYLNMLSWVSEPEETYSLPFLPWSNKGMAPWPAIPASIAFGFGAVTTLGLTKLKGKKK